jgi:hypothetical protein
MPTEKKSNRHNDHEVPLSTRAIRLLKNLRPLTVGSKFLFPSNSSIDKPMSPSTLNAMFNRMRYVKLLAPHGIRATASTILNDRGFRGVPPRDTTLGLEEIASALSPPYGRAEQSPGFQPQTAKIVRNTPTRPLVHRRPGFLLACRSATETGARCAD